MFVFDSFFPMIRVEHLIIVRSETGAYSGDFGEVSTGLLHVPFTVEYF